ncbi:MAG: hypothetical protein IKK82_02450 [Kiritimatiellae bacterium]|nr:hypothetical protein [Kiritimatiellia bacterium]
MKRTAIFAATAAVITAVASIKSFAEDVPWVFNDSGRVGEVKSSALSSALTGIETFGVMYDISNEIYRFRTIPAYLKIIIR